MAVERGGSVMASFKDVLQFIIYWLLTFLYGVFYFYYFSFRFLFGMNPKVPQDQNGRQVQPTCLTDPIYGVHKFIKIQGIKIHYVDSGDKNAKLVLLLHGTPGFWFCWRKQIPVLSTTFRVVALDLRGCGDSDCPSRKGGFNMETIVQDLVQLISSLGYSSAYVVCCETSGHFGWELAARYPDLVTKLVFINAPHPLVIHYLFHAKSYYYFKYWYLLFLQIPILPEIIHSQEATTSWLKSVLEPAIKAKGLTKEEVEAYNYTFSRQDDWRGVLNHLRLIDLKPRTEKRQPYIITAPTLILMGSSHPYLAAEAAYRSAEFVERVKIHIIADAANNLQVTHPKKTNEELLKFLLGPKLQEAKQPAKPSLVGRVFGAVTSPYAMRNSDAVTFTNGLREVAQNTLNSGKSLAQTVWSGNKENYDILHTVH